MQPEQRQSICSDNSLRALFINFQKSEVSNHDYLKEFQARVASLDNYSTNVLDLIACLLKEEVKEKLNEGVKDANETKLKAAKKNLKKQHCCWLELITEVIMK